MEQAVTVNTPLTEDEANALCYVAGYVLFTLQKKLQHRPEFRHCLEIWQLHVRVQQRTT